MCVSLRKWPQDITPSCGLHSWAVDISSRSIEKWRNQDTLANQNSSDTNMQSRKSTESPVAVLIDVQGCSSIDEREPSDKSVMGNFLSLFSNISCGCVVNNKLTANERGTPIPPLVFATDLQDLKKIPLRTFKKRNSVINWNTFTLAKYTLKSQIHAHTWCLWTVDQESSK